jgi:hypothetical protein
MIYTPDQCRQVMAETDRLLAKDVRLQSVVGTATAAAETGPPVRPRSFHDEVVDHMKNGQTQAQAVRSAAISRPDLRAKFVKQSNEKRELELEVEKATARRRHALRR